LFLISGKEEPEFSLKCLVVGREFQMLGYQIPLEAPKQSISKCGKKKQTNNEKNSHIAIHWSTVRMARLKDKPTEDL
jgi:hypothetical protein